MSKDQTENQRKALERATTMLSEHFDHVLILASKDQLEVYDDFWHYGMGNIYAKKGMLHRMLEIQEHDSLANEIGDHLEPPDTDASWKDES